MICCYIVLVCFVLVVLFCLLFVGYVVDVVDSQVEYFFVLLYLFSGNVVVLVVYVYFVLKLGYGFFNVCDVQCVFSELWDNLLDKDVLGMILFSDDLYVLLDEDSWVVVVIYVDDGYVFDVDVVGIDYDKMLCDMQESVYDENVE